MKSYDIELALINLPKKELQEISKVLPAGYLVEDRSNKGWGIVIRLDSENELESLNDQVKAFITGVLPIKKWMELSSPVLRVACFNDKLTCTINLEDFELFVSLKIKLEISIYPVT